MSRERAKKNRAGSPSASTETRRPKKKQSVEHDRVWHQGAEQSEKKVGRRETGGSRHALAIATTAITIVLEAGPVVGTWARAPVHWRCSWPPSPVRRWPRAAVCTASHATADRAGQPAERHGLRRWCQRLDRWPARPARTVSAAVTPGEHMVTVQQPDAVTETQAVEVPAEGSTVELTLWRSHPAVRLLQPFLLGAAIADAMFLTEDRLGLVVSLPGNKRPGLDARPGRPRRRRSVRRGRPEGATRHPSGLARPRVHATIHQTPDSINVAADRLAEVWIAGLGDGQGHAVSTVDQPDEEHRYLRHPHWTSHRVEDDRLRLCRPCSLLAARAHRPPVSGRSGAP